MAHHQKADRGAIADPDHAWLAPTTRAMTGTRYDAPAKQAPGGRSVEIERTAIRELDKPGALPRAVGPISPNQPRPREDRLHNER